MHEPTCLGRVGGDGAYAHVPAFTATVPTVMAPLTSWAGGGKYAGSPRSKKTTPRPPTPERAHFGFRCGELDWLGPVAGAPDCQQRVLARPASQCSHRYFVLADFADNNCACAPPDSDCAMGSPEVRVAEVASVYRIAPALSGSPLRR